MALSFDRHRRLRQTAAIRAMVRETHLRVEDLIYPLFVVEGSGIKREVPSMPGVYHLSLDRLSEEVDDIAKLGIPAVMVFGVPNEKDEVGSQAYCETGIVQRAIRQIKAEHKDLVTSRSPSKKPGTGGTTPILPATGSTITAAMSSPNRSNA